MVIFIHVDVPSVTEKYPRTCPEKQKRENMKRVDEKWERI